MKTLLISARRPLAALGLLLAATLAQALQASITSPADHTAFTAPATVTINATASSGMGHAIQKVDFYQGSTLIGTATTAPYSVTWSNVPAGIYSLTAKATDSVTNSTATSSAVNIKVGNPFTVSLTSPTANQSFTAPASITLTADAADSDGTVRSVDFYQGTTLIGSDSSAPYTKTWSNVQPGSYSLTAIATDNQGFITTSAAIPITVSGSTTVSLTSPAANTIFKGPATLTLTANAADSDGTVSKVDFYQGSSRIGTAYGAPYTVTWSNALPGSYSLTAKATNNQGVVTTSAAIPITVVSNLPPTVSLTSPAANTVFTAPATLTLTANAADSDGSVRKVDFYQGTTLIGTATAAPYTVTWSNAPSGSYSLTAKATDDRGNVATSAAIPIVVDTPPTVSLTSPAANTVFNASAPVTLTANAADSDGTVAKVDFYQGTTLIGTATAAPYTVTWSNAPAGSYSLTAQATDNQGVVTTSAALPIVVNALPTVSLTSPAANTVFTAPATLTLTASAADSDGTVAKVDFYQGTTLIGTATAAPYTVTWSNAPSGSYSLTAQATDDRGNVATSAAIPIVVDTPPTVSLTSPAANTVFNASAPLTLTANAADSDGTVAKVDFYQGSTLIGTATAAPYTVTWSNAPAGNHSLTAKATDNQGLATTSAAVPVTVRGVSSVYYLYSDHLNTPRLATDEWNVVTWRSLPLTEPFGTAPPEEDPDGDGVPLTLNLRFPGQYFDKETNLNYNYFRDYDPSTGRYIQSDPIGLDGGINTYAYVGGNPLGNTDPLGLLVVNPNGTLSQGYGGPGGGGGSGAGGEAGAMLLGLIINSISNAISNAMSGSGAESASSSNSESRSIPAPPRPKCGCTCTCRADANQNDPKNTPAFAFGTATEHNCAEASKVAKRNATRALGQQPKHVGCRCTES